MGVGVGLAVRRFRFKKIGWVALVISVGCFAGAVVFERTVVVPHQGAGRIALGLASAAILLCLVELERKEAIVTPRLLYLLGSVSYSVYLAHPIFINIIYSVLLKLGLYHRLPEFAIFLMGSLGSILFAVMIGLFVERPLVVRLKPVLVKS
jgi:peptidoglycan/LPS O-acetylase OafA/YrhL